MICPWPGSSTCQGGPNELYEHISMLKSQKGLSNDHVLVVKSLMSSGLKNAMRTDYIGKFFAS